MTISLPSEAVADEADVAEAAEVLAALADVEAAALVEALSAAELPDDAGAYDEHFTEFNGVDEPTGENDPDYKKYSSDSGIETDWSLWDAEGEAPSSKAQSSYTIN